MIRTHTCGELRAEHAGTEVSLCGWVRHRRDHGGLLFLDLGDRYGVSQVVVEPDAAETARSTAERLRLEWVVRVVGEVRLRPDRMRNPDRETGDVEVVAQEVEILNAAAPVPVAVMGEERTAEEIGLKYRYLELRRPEVREAILLRAEILRICREHMMERSFVEVETPALLRSTPEGARDYLVPSRVHPGSFYALLQSPQLLKQLLMIGGLDRYWQIVRCFRDEDPRADRQPEFTQLDVEMSFADEDDVLEIGEALFVRLAREIAGVEIPLPFPRLSYAEAMSRYGSDKPDLRFGLPIHDVTDLLAGCAFGVFSGAVGAGGVVRAIALPPEHRLSRKQLDSLPAVVADRGARGVAWCRLAAEGWSGAAAKHLTDEEKTGLLERTGATEGGILLFLAGPESVAAPAAGDLRLHLGRMFGLQEGRGFAPVWIRGFPLLEWSEEEQRWDATHHPFTAPVPEDVPLLDTEPGKVRSLGYDLAVNGHELIGGSVRIHSPELQLRVLGLLGMEQAEAEERFGFFLEALRYGTPPHAGFAAGVDRLVAVLLGRENIREVIAFPKTLQATDLMTQAPAPVDPAQLAELGLRLAEGPA